MGEDRHFRPLSWVHRSLNWFRRIFPLGVRRVLAKLRLWLLVLFALAFSGAIIAAVFGYFPIVTDLSRFAQGLFIGLAIVLLPARPNTISCPSAPGARKRGGRRAAVGMSRPHHPFSA